MEERLRFVAEYLEGVATMTELAEEYGISRETGYTWVRRYDAEGPAGLHDRSRRPHRSANATPQAVIDALVEARRRHPTWGPKKLLTYGWPLTTRPARSTASAILKRAGLIDRRRRRRRPGHPGRPPAVIAAPNVLWTIDFKGQFRTGDRRWCYPLTLIDSCSRYVLACDGLRSTQTATARAVLERARPIADGLWGGYFGPLVLGHYDERRGPTYNLAPVTRGRSPANAGSRPPSKAQ
jgi:transposase-like protein